MSELLSPPGTTIVSPDLIQRGHKPKVGERLTVEMPGERILTVVEGVVGPDIVLCSLDAVPVSRQHPHTKKGELIQARRDLGDHGQECWRWISEHELQQQEARARLAAQRQREEEIAARARVQAIRDRDLASQARTEAGKRAVLGPRRSHIRRQA